jgi:hypothetical protein
MPDRVSMIIIEDGFTGVTDTGKASLIGVVDTGIEFLAGQHIKSSLFLGITKNQNDNTQEPSANFFKNCSCKNLTRLSLCSNFEFYQFTIYNNVQHTPDLLNCVTN